MLDPQALASRYMTGISLRKLGAEIGKSDFTVRYHLRKLPSYNSLLSSILRQRVSDSENAYRITRSPANQRRLKHSLAMLRKHRPAIYKRMVECLKPKRCSGCSRPIQARRSASFWIWSCEWCGKGGIERQSHLRTIAISRG